jgi:hypothetical protein
MVVPLVQLMRLPLRVPRLVWPSYPFAAAALRDNPTICLATARGRRYISGTVSGLSQPVNYGPLAIRTGLDSIRLCLPMVRPVTKSIMSIRVIPPGCSPPVAYTQAESISAWLTVAFILLARILTVETMVPYRFRNYGVWGALGTVAGGEVVGAWQ